MSDNHARARESAEAWLAGLTRTLPFHSVFTRSAVESHMRDAYVAGFVEAEAKCAAIHREEQDGWVWARDVGQRQLEDATALMRETAELLRAYEAHHRAKVRATDEGELARSPISDDQWGRLQEQQDAANEKADRNALAAERLEAWLRGEDQYPVSLRDGVLTYATAIEETPGGGQERVALRGIENPAEALRGIAERTAADLGVGVDHESFDQAAQSLDEMVFPEADPGVPIPVAGNFERVVETCSECGRFRGVIRYSKVDHHPFGDHACRYDPERDGLAEGDGRTLDDCRAKFDTGRFAGLPGEDTVVAHGQPIDATGTDGRTRPGGFEPDVLEAMRAAAGHPDVPLEERVEARTFRPGGSADLTAFRIITGDPRFNPGEPVTVNGYLYHPAKESAT